MRYLAAIMCIATGVRLLVASREPITPKPFLRKFAKGPEDLAAGIHLARTLRSLMGVLAIVLAVILALKG